MEAIFDHAAINYDELFSKSEIGKLQRNLIWQYLNKHFTSEKSIKVLELNCGTGLDAIFLARQGHSILATDLSAKMIETAKVNVEREQMSKNIQFDKASIEELIANGSVSKINQYDLVFSNFGGLNCLNPNSFSDILNKLPNLLKKEARFIAVIMPSFCLIETIYFLLKLDVKNAFRRIGQKKVLAKVGDHFQDTWYYSPNFVKKRLNKNMDMVTQKPIGFLIPPSYLEPFFEKRRYLLKTLNYWDNKLNNWQLLAKFSDHFLIDFIKK